LPVVSNTGAVRLESKADGLFWLQLSVKSMMFNARTGSRVADNCQPRQVPAPVLVAPPAIEASPAVAITVDSAPIAPVAK
jgi:hypothetical protein